MGKIVKLDDYREYTRELLQCVNCKKKATYTYQEHIGKAEEMCVKCHEYGTLVSVY